jgi:hypothetical protein
MEAANGYPFSVRLHTTPLSRSSCAVSVAIVIVALLVDYPVYHFVFHWRLGPLQGRGTIDDAKRAVKKK